VDLSFLKQGAVLGAVLGFLLAEANGFVIGGLVGWFLEEAFTYNVFPP